MPRTSAGAVKGVLLREYDYKNNPDLSPFMEAASALVDQVALAVPAPDAAALERIERWLSAHMYQMSDKGLASRSTGGASGSFQGQTGQGFSATMFGQTAMRLDITGTLKILDNRQTAGAIWLGKRPSAQVPYDRRS